MDGTIKEGAWIAVQEHVGVTDQEPPVPGRLGPEVPELGPGRRFVPPHPFVFSSVEGAAEIDGQPVGAVRGAVIDYDDLVRELPAPAEHSFEVLVLLVFDQ
jgi:hypothetical protein